MTASLRPSTYLPRLLDVRMERDLKAFGAIEVAGAKFCGKTWSSMAHGESIVHIDDDNVRQAVEFDVNLALDGTAPHIIDEWQDVPKIWDAVRRRVDASANAPGQFILTGSSTVDKARVSHSGAGRIARIHMRPMSLLESGDSDGSVSLQGLFEGEFRSHMVEMNPRNLARLICRGGFPAAINATDDVLGVLPAQYLNALFEVSASQKGLDSHRARRVALSLARNIGKTLTYKTLFADVESEEPSKVDASVAQQQLEPYVSFLQDQYFIESQSGWDAPVKAKSRVRLKPRRSFADPSLPASLLGLTAERLLFEGQIFGNLFEELCLRDLRVYASAMLHTPEPGLYYYADSDGLEVDAVLELADGRWAGIEIKLSEEKVPQAVRNLVRLRNKVMSNPAARNKEPSFLAVLVGNASFCRKTEEGVYVFPITCLGA